MYEDNKKKDSLTPFEYSEPRRMEIPRRETRETREMSKPSDIEVFRNSDGDYVLKSRRIKGECLLSKESSPEEIGLAILKGFELTKEEKFDAIENMLAMKEPRPEHIKWVQSAIGVLVEMIKKGEI